MMAMEVMLRSSRHEAVVFLCMQNDPGALVPAAAETTWRGGRGSQRPDVGSRQGAVWSRVQHYQAALVPSPTASLLDHLDINTVTASD